MEKQTQPISMVGVDQTIWRRFQAACKLSGKSTKEASEKLWKEFADKILESEGGKI